MKWTQQQKQKEKGIQVNCKPQADGWLDAEYVVNGITKLKVIMAIYVLNVGVLVAVKKVKTMNTDKTITENMQATGCFNGLCIWCWLMDMFVNQYPQQKEELIAKAYLGIEEQERSSVYNIQSYNEQLNSSNTKICILSPNQTTILKEIKVFQLSRLCEIL